MRVPKADPDETQVLVGVSVLRRMLREGMVKDDHPAQLVSVVTDIYRAMKEAGNVFVSPSR